ncbi:MAG TPA: FTR1 family protein, partial [Crenalkalicoccus sp.]|nr:FTR1 family protein [Crenalkalicoccus sp.]
MSLALASQSALILLREGLEAILVLAALGAVLRRAAPERVVALHGGAGFGLLASILAAGGYIAWHGGDHDDVVEGITCLAAAACMLWTGGWLWLRADPRAWTASLKRQAEQALASRRVALAIGAIGFLAVFREGAETALFLAALGQDGGMAGLLVGLAVGAVGLAVLWRVVTRAVVRLPLRPLFLATSVFLLLMAVKLVGAAITEFQQQLLVGFTPNGLPEGIAEFGPSATWEGLVAQLAVLAMVIGVLAWQ